MAAKFELFKKKTTGTGVSKDKTSGAVKANPFATGKTRYGAAGTKTAATSGPVDKKGYREREIRKRAAAKIRKARKN